MRHSISKKYFRVEETAIAVVYISTINIDFPIRNSRKFLLLKLLGTVVWLGVDEILYNHLRIVFNHQYQKK